MLHLYLGELAYARPQFAQAVNLLTGAGNLMKRSFDVTAQLAVSELDTGEVSQGLDLLSHVPMEQLHPRMQFEVGNALGQAGLPGRAVPYLQAFTLSNPDSYDAGFDLAVRALNAKQYALAISTANSLVSRGHETSELDDVLAEAEEADTKTQAAVDTLRRAIALDPKDEGNYLEFASICLEHRAFDDGLKVLDVGIQLVPNSDRLVLERGILHAMQDHFNLAEKDFERASTMNPGKDTGTIGLGVTYLERGQSEQAVGLLRKNLTDKPDDPNLLYLLGEALLHSGALPGEPSYAEAQRSLERAVQIAPDLGEAHTSLGRIYLAENKNADAVTQLEQARSSSPQETSVYAHLAVAYRRLGEKDKATQALDQLRTINDKARGVVAIKAASEKREPLAIPRKSQEVHP